MTDHLRTPPRSTLAERAVLGGLLMEVRAWPVVCEIVSVTDFYRKAHKLIFSAIASQANGGLPFDVITLAEHLERSGELENMGGLPYLVRLVEETPSAANIKSYARSVREHADRRRLIAIGGQIIESATGLASPLEIVNDAEASFVHLTEQNAQGSPRTIAEIAGPAYLAELENRATGTTRGLATGFADFDQLTNGLRPGQLIVVASRPAQGKSTLALNVAEHVAVKNLEPTLLFSLEMSEAEIMDRLVASLGRIPLSDVIQGNLDSGNFSGALRAITKAPLFIDDAGALFINQIRARALRIKRKTGLSLLIIDYLQLVRAKAENRFQEVSEVSRSLKALAKELKVPIIALSQLNREIESRPGGRPRLSDLRESGQLEQDADLVSFLYGENIDTETDVVTWAIEKQRNGPTGKVHLAARLQYARFDNYAGRIEIPPPAARFEYT